MGWDPINDIRYGVEKERAQLAETGLNESAGFMNSVLGTLTGATQEGVDNKRAAIASADAKRTYKTEYELATGKEWTNGLTSGAAARAIKEAGKSEATQDTITAAQTMYDLPGAREERRLNREAIARSERNRLDDRIDARESENRKFEYQKLQDRKEDRRYNENLDRLDMKDRRMAISGMTGGLAALAAAFAM